MLTDKDRNIAWEIIKSLSLPDDFGPTGDDAWFETDDISNQISGIGDFFVTYGVTKMVIVPDELPFVIKVPFNGHWVDEYDEDDNKVPSSFNSYCFATAESFYEIGDPKFSWPKIAHGTFNEKNTIYGIYLQKCKCFSSQ